MNNELLQGRFQNSKRIPWPEILGKKQEGRASAKEAWKNYGPYDVNEQPVYFGEKLAFDKHVANGYKALVRGPFAGDEEDKLLNIVSKKYNLITPKTVVALWDEHVAKPVEVIGGVDAGERFFLATSLPSMDVKGDEISNTLIVWSPMNGRESLQAMVAPIRLVCVNGLVTIGKAQASLRMAHYIGSTNQLAEWLSGVWKNSIATIEELEGIYAKLAGTKVTSKLKQKVLDAVYPLPTKDKYDNPADYQHNFDWNNSRRETVRNLFAGQGTGMDVPATEGTAWGLFNAIVELQDYGKGNWTRTANIGNGAQRKKRALEILAAA